MNMAAATLQLWRSARFRRSDVAALIILWTGWLPADPLLSLLVCALLERSAWTLVKKSTHILLDGAPEWLNIAELRAVLERDVPAIEDVHHVHCWLAGPHETLLTMFCSSPRMQSMDTRGYAARQFGEAAMLLPHTSRASAHACSRPEQATQRATHESLAHCGRCSVMPAHGTR
jgi:cobalt-zinc-cadmium efflux system protein